MQAQDVRITDLVDGQKQFIVPVFQRDYSWGTKHCLQLWDDVVRVGSDKNTKAHFIGSIVYIEAEETFANITRWLLIDGQQRLTTLTLMLAALRKRMLADAYSRQPCQARPHHMADQTSSSSIVLTSGLIEMEWCAVGSMVCIATMQIILYFTIRAWRSIG